MEGWALRHRALLACLFLVTACGQLPGQSGPLQITGTDSDGGQFELTIIGPADLVTAAQSLTRPGGLSDEGVQLDADGRGALIWWSGVPCENHPSIEVSGASATVRIDIDRGPPSGDACSHNEVQFTVQLDFSKAFAAAEMDR
jgi:hypothetical protein